MVRDSVFTQKEPFVFESPLFTTRFFRKGELIPHLRSGQHKENEIKEVIFEKDQEKEVELGRVNGRNSTEHKLKIKITNPDAFLKFLSEPLNQIKQKRLEELKRAEARVKEVEELLGLSKSSVPSINPTASP